jgi:quercetin dioxygenase-like cupin family protein
MTDTTESGLIPADDPNRGLTIARPADDGSHLHHVSLAGDTYTILLTGEDTADKFCLIDMHVPPGGGPPPHRHDFEEAFTLLEGQVEAVFRGEKTIIRAGETVNIPANAPHSFRNVSDGTVRMLCICAPAGQDAFFMEVGDAVPSATSPAPELTDAEQAERRNRAAALASHYKTEFIR